MKFATKKLARAWQLIRTLMWTAGAVFFLLTTEAQTVSNSTCLVDWNSVHQRIGGFGASSAFVSGWTGDWADMFFSTNAGIGLSLLRSRIPPDNSTPDYAIMQMAQARGATVWSTPWSPPAADKDSGTVNGGYFLSSHNQDYANHLANYVVNMESNYQVNIFAVSVQNEPDYNSLSYETCIWTGQQIHDFIPYLYQTLTNAGVGSTKILIDENGLWDFALTTNTMDDPVTAGMVGILGAHDYDYTVSPENSAGKPLWQTEVANLGGIYDGSITNALYWAAQISAFMTYAQANTFHYWWMIPAATDNEGLTDASGNPAKRMYALGQFSRFVRPGYYRIDAGNSGGTLTSAYKDPASGNFAIVAINTNSTAVNQFFQFANFNSGSVTPWITSSQLSLAPQPAVAMANASFSYLLPPQSVVTFVGRTNLGVSVTAQPQDQIVDPGQSAIFSVRATGALPLSYFWLQNGVPISGAVNAVYSLTNLPISASGTRFSCIVSNQFGAVVSSAATLTVPTPVCVEPLPGIVAWWLDGSNAVDVIGGNNGVLANGAAFTNALIGNGFLLGGGSDFVQLPPNLLPSVTAGAFSIELWFETTAGGVILEQQSAPPFGYPGTGWVPDMYVGTNGDLYVQLFWNGDFDQISTSTPVNDGIYHHLAVTYDGTNEVLYVDGGEVGIKRLQYSAYANGFYSQFGTGYTQNWPAATNGWFGFNGVIDQPTLYSNALSAAQVQAIYRAGSAGKCISALLPVIGVQPTNQSVATGSTVFFTISATSLLPLTYQWLDNGAIVAGATNTTFVLNNAQVAASGSQFSCSVSTVYGSITSPSALLVVTNIPPACLPPPVGVEAWWSDGSDGVDIIGGNNGVLAGGVGFTNALVGNGFVFNGGGSYVQLPVNLFPPANAGAFSIELWFQTTSGGVILEQQAMASFAAPGNGWVPELYVGTDGHLYAQLFWDGSFNQISTGSAVNDGQYHHLAVTYDGTTETLYLDGVVVGKKALPYSNYTSGFYCQFGTGYTQYWPAGNGGWYTFSGIIDQPTLYTNTLTAAQVQAIYNVGSLGKCIPGAPPVNLAPSIASEPVSRTTVANQNVTFTLSASGATPLSYLWQENGVALPGGTNMTFSLTNVLLSASGSRFSCIVSNPYGVVTSSIAVLTVQTAGCVPPSASIESWWWDGSDGVDVIGGHNGVLAGGVGFTNALVGNGFVFNGGSSYVQLPENLYPPANAGAFSIELWFQTTSGGVILEQQAMAPFATPGNGWAPELYVGTDGHLYAQLFWDGAFNQISTGVAVNDGIYHHLAVTYDGATETLYLDGVVVGNKALPYSTYTSGFYCQFGTGYTQYWPAGNGGWYPFNGIIDQPTLYTNALTAAQVLAIYTARAEGKCASGLLPVIVSGPTNQTVGAGSAVSFSVSATGTSTLNYQWLGNGVVVPGATNATYLLVSTVLSNSGSLFSCEVSNIAGVAVSSTATLTVTNVPPSCLPPPAGIAAWWSDGSDGVDTIGGNNGVLAGGVGFTNAFVGNGFVFNGGSSYVQLPVNLFPPANAGAFSIELWFQTTSGGVILEQQAMVPFAAPGNGWVPELYVGTDGHLYAQLFWDGSFNQISTGVAVNDGNYHHLAVTYDGANETLYLDGVAVGNKALPYSTYTSGFYCQFGTGYTQYWPAGNGGWYTFSGIIDQPTLYTNALTATQVQSIYKVGNAGKCIGELPPVIVSGPTNQTVGAGSAVSFSVSATSLLPLNYQWLGNGVVVPGATNATYLLASTALSNSGSLFSCKVSNVAGVAVSSAAMLTVTNVTVSCVPPPSGIMAWWSDGSDGVDIIGGNNGVLAGGVGFTNALVGSGFVFNGGSSYVQLPVNLFPPANAGAFSIELWFQTTSGGVILEQQAMVPFAAPGNGWVPELYVGRDGHLYAQLFWDGSFNQINTGVAVNDGNYHHLAVTYNGATETLYLDGVTVGSRVLAYSNYTSGFYCQFGTGYTQYWPAGNGGWFAFSGIIDQPTLYTNTLTAAQVQAIYNAGGAGKCLNKLSPIVSTQPGNLVAAVGTSSPFTFNAKLLPNKDIELFVTGTPGQVFHLLGSTDFMNWQTIAALTNYTGTLQFTDSASTNLNCRFYRMMSP